MTFEKLLIFVNSLIPLAMLGFDAWRGRLGANPVEFFLRTTGVLALIFLVLTLSVTPLRKLTGNNSIVKLRRMIGLFAFFYATVHLITYSIFDKSLDIATIVDDVRQRPFIAVGSAALLLLVPLAVTSTNGMIKRLGGRRWAKLHKLTYVAAILGVVHFVLIVKSDYFYPGIFGIAVGGLLVYRFYAWATQPRAGKARVEV